jgi:hypothetical protein
VQRLATITGRYPRECHLHRGGCDLLGDLPHAADDGQVGAQRVLLEAWQPASEVVFGQVVERGEPSGEEAAS